MGEPATGTTWLMRTRLVGRVERTERSWVLSILDNRNRGHAKTSVRCLLLDAPGHHNDTRSMDYEDFKGTFLHALAGSGLRILASHPQETIDLRTTDRTYALYVEPVEPRRGNLFYVNAEISWRWGALQTARTITTEGDLLAELLGRDVASTSETENGWLRIDLKLRAGVQPDAVLPVPDSASWTKWCRTVMKRLDGRDRLVTKDEADDGSITSWQGHPETKVTCSKFGDLLVDSMSVSAFQIVRLPRDDDEQEQDDNPDAQVEKMFGRVKRALAAWQDCLKHLE
jgi:hypothetical protein